MKNISPRIVGTGSYLPEKILTNSDLEKLVETSDEWITTRTGMKERRIASSEETAASMGAEAARKALEDAGIGPDDIDLILVATGSPDMFFPSTACFIQKSLQAKKAAAFDLSAACSGFIYGLSVAEQYIRTGKYKRVLLVASEVISRYLDWEDRTTCILFGDAASAVVIEGEEDSDRGIISTHIYSDGTYADFLYLVGGGGACSLNSNSLDEKEHLLKMKGNSTFKVAVKRMIQVSREALKANGLQVSDIDLLIPHQANLRIISAVGDTLGIEKEKVVINIEKYGNTVAATIPLALDEAIKEGRLKEGDLVLMVAFGGGLTWGSTLIKW